MASRADWPDGRTVSQKPDGGRTSPFPGCHARRSGPTMSGALKRLMRNRWTCADGFAIGSGGPATRRGSLLRRSGSREAMRSPNAPRPLIRSPGNTIAGRPIPRIKRQSRIRPVSASFCPIPRAPDQSVAGNAFFQTYDLICNIALVILSSRRVPGSAGCRVAVPGISYVPAPEGCDNCQGAGGPGFDRCETLPVS